MTAEIAIMNRNAVTLATDSAVTLTVRGSEKIYNSADKLFELSDRDPLGIMVYNNLEYMGISLEVAIKQFRGKSLHYGNVALAAQAFFDYLVSDLRPDEELQRQHAKSIIFELFYGIRGRFERRITREFEQNRENPRNLNPSAIFTLTVKGRISELEAVGVAECFSDTPEAAILEFYSAPMDEAIGVAFDDLPLDDEQKALLKHAAVLLLHRAEPSDACTGLVFAGFGELETFPSLVAYKTDGVILGKIKRIETDKETTNRSEVTGKILPFAQREMVDRFLYGIDPAFEQAIERYMARAVETTGNALITSLPKGTRKVTKEKLRKALEAAANTATTQWRERMIPLYKGRFMQEVQDMIFLMPKQDLAALAEELINLTSVKRKFSSGKESVGGPIDVAVISRVDGFVWVRRKHYFEAKLNPRYFHRKFGAVPLQTEEAK